MYSTAIAGAFLVCLQFLAPAAAAPTHSSSENHVSLSSNLLPQIVPRALVDSVGATIAETLSSLGIDSCPTETCPADQISGSAQTIVDAINVFTKFSRDLQSPASNMGSSSDGIAAAAQVTEGLKQITSEITKDITTFRSTPIFDAKCDETAIVIALAEFVSVNRELLDIMVGKAQIMEQVPSAGVPLTAALKALNGVIDTLGTVIIGLVPDQASCAQALVDDLKKTFANTRRSYSTCEAPQTCETGQISQSAQTVVNTLNEITAASQELQGPAGLLSASSVGEISAVAAGLSAITYAETKEISQLGSLNQFDAGCDTEGISAAWTKLVKVQQDLLDILIRKASSVQEVPLSAAPISAALRSLEGISDSFANAVTGLIPTQACYATYQATLLTTRVSEAVAAYSS